MSRHALPFLPLLLAACSGGDGGGSKPDPLPTPSPTLSPSPTPSPSPGGEPADQAITEAAAAIAADTCFRMGGSNCAWTERAYDLAEFGTMPGNEAILIIDDFPRLPVRAIRFRKHIRGFHRLVAGGDMASAASGWRIPTVLFNALERFSGPNFTPSHRLKPISDAANASYSSVGFDNVGHGSTVFSLIADNSPGQPLVLMDSIDLKEVAPGEYCDTSGAVQTQARLVEVAQHAANAIGTLIRANGVRFINYSAGHSFQTVRDSWQEACGSAVPADKILRQKLAAYAPIYAVLFATPGVLAVQAAGDSGGMADAPYDQRIAAHHNRLRVGYFTALASGLDDLGRGNVAGLQAWPAPTQADIFVNTGVLPARPYTFNQTPLLQADGFSASLSPITAPATSWVTPLALARMIHLRYSAFPSRPFDDTLIADIFDAATPGLCAAQPDNRCALQDPMLHGQTEAVRLGYRAREFTGF